jgi:hypothetical protein
MNPLTDAAGSFRFYTGLFLLGTLVGCSDGPSPRDPSWTLVPITDLNMVVGEWEGTVKKERATFAGGSVRLMIRANGTYLFVGQNVQEVAVGTGFLELRDGRLIGDTERRAVMFSLYDHKGKTALHVEAKNLETQTRHHGEFTRVQ